MTRVRLLLTVLALAAAAACDRTDPPTGPRRASIPHALATVNVLTVSNTNDAGDGSLRKAIADAQPGDVIHFGDAIAGQIITLTSGPLSVDKALTIEGSATAGMTISGGNNSRVVSVTSTGDLTLRNLTITDGLELSGDGAGLRNAGKLTIENSLVSNNQVVWDGAGAEGGGIYNASGATLKLVNSTVSGNTSRSNGGGILSRGAMTLIHTTIALNKSTGSAGGGFDAQEGSLFIRNSIVAFNDSYATSNDACRVLSGVDLIVLGKSIIDEPGCITDPGIAVLTPSLYVLANFGGPTKTHAYIMGSRGIDEAPDCPVAEDQRHVARPQGFACDIGAYEFNDYVKTPIAIDEGVAVNASTGVAIVTGTLSCTSPVSITMEVDLSQPQKSGRATVTAKASGLVLVNCSTSKAWSISLVPPTGTFINGPGSVTVRTLPSSLFVTPSTATAAVKLYWGRK